MSPDPIFHPHMSPYVGMDDNPVALCDPYGLATGGDGGRPNWKTKPVSKQSKKTNARVPDGSSESRTKLGKFFDKIGDFAENVGEGLAKAGKFIGKHVEESFESSGEDPQSHGGGGGTTPPPSPANDPLKYIYNIYVDMINAKPEGKLTSQGYPRNLIYFWKAMVKNMPEAFSQANLDLILIERKSPKVDAQWVKFFPSHADFMGERLEHHHIGGGRYATAMPETPHRRLGWKGVTHSINYNPTKYLRYGGRILILTSIGIMCYNVATAQNTTQAVVDEGEGLILSIIGGALGSPLGPWGTVAGSILFPMAVGILKVELPPTPLPNQRNEGGYYTAPPDNTGYTP